MVKQTCTEVIVKPCNPMGKRVMGKRGMVPQREEYEIVYRWGKRGTERNPEGTVGISWADKMRKGGRIEYAKV